MGNLKDVAGMIPGMGKAMKNIEIDDDAFKHIEAIIYSMTPKPNVKTQVINGSVANGLQMARVQIFRK
jgi:signal recognition particle subunit SRP54